jgi:redox-sensitive bicupin YhaK (pirin superfamily)
LIAGELDSVSGAARDVPIDPLYLDLRLPANGSAMTPVPAGYSAFVYVYAGEVAVVGAKEVAPVSLSSGVAGMLSNGGGVQCQTGARAGLLLMAA